MNYAVKGTVKSGSGLIRNNNNKIINNKGRPGNTVKHSNTEKLVSWTIEIKSSWSVGRDETKNT